MKKALAMALAILTTALAGCSAASPPSSGSGEPSQRAIVSQSEPAGPAQPDTVRWINATYAMLTAANQGDPNIVGGFEKTESNQERVINGLKDSWNVFNREDADENLDWILADGHRAGFLEEIELMNADGVFEMTEEEAIALMKSYDFDDNLTATYLTVIDAYEKRGEKAIDAWDYCRALQLLGWYYVAGYYTEEEALDKSLEVARELQQIYSSWDELADSYLDGYTYWVQDDPSDPTSDSAIRRAVYRELKEQADSPYLVDWNTSLEKSW